MQILAAVEMFCGVKEVHTCKACGMKMGSKVELEAHGTSCVKSVKAREFSEGRREKLAKTGKALPGGGFPIVNRNDLTNARRAVGRAKNPAAARAHIRDQAKEMGVKLPGTWKKAS